MNSQDVCITAVNECYLNNKLDNDGFTKLQSAWDNFKLEPESGLNQVIADAECLENIRRWHETYNSLPHSK